MCLRRRCEMQERRGGGGGGGGRILCLRSCVQVVCKRSMGDCCAESFVRCETGVEVWNGRRKIHMNPNQTMKATATAFSVDFNGYKHSVFWEVRNGCRRTLLEAHLYQSRKMAN